MNFYQYKKFKRDTYHRRLDILECLESIGPGISQSDTVGNPIPLRYSSFFLYNQVHIRFYSLKYGRTLRVEGQSVSSLQCIHTTGRIELGIEHQ